MSDQTGGALALEDVTRRFAESEETLAKAREQLRGLIDAERGAATSAASLSSAASAVAAFIERADLLLGDLQQAQSQVREVLEAGARFLDGSELRDVKQAVDSLRESFEGELATLRARVGDVDAANARAEDAKVELTRIKGLLGSRQLRKLGLE
jgi:hypothetical protein